MLLQGAPILGVSLLDYKEAHKQWDFTSDWGNRLYYSFYSRFQTYGVGLLFGIAVYDLNRIKAVFKKYALNTRITIVGCIWTLAFVLAILSIYGCYPTNQGHLMGRGATAMYNATFRLLWGFFVGVVILFCTLGYGGVINDILSSKFWIPFARVNYTTYISHLVFLDLYSLTLEQDKRFTTLTYTVMVSGFLMCINCCSLVLSCILEAPFIQLEKILFRR